MRTNKWLSIGLVWLSTACAAMAHRFDPSAKRAVVDKTNQELRGYEGDNLVFVTNISTGRMGKETPSGRFHVIDKQMMHYSRRYDNAPMPYSVQIAGNFFIHGFSSVPSYPASHGCIRVPLTGENPAKQFYQWSQHGMPVTVTGHWQSSQVEQAQPVRQNSRFLGLLWTLR